MTTVTLRMPDNLVHNIDAYAMHLHISRSEYIKKAILNMNKMLLEETRAQKLAAASLKVRQESMAVNAEFGEIEYDPKD